MRSMNKLGMLVLLLPLLFACESGDGGKREGGDKGGQQSGPQEGQSSNANGTAGGLCSGLMANQALVALASRDVNLLCNNLAALRVDANVYKGEPSAKVITHEAMEVPGADSLSRVVLISSLRQVNQPKFFFSKVKLEVTDPLYFKETGFEMTPDEDYIDHEALERNSDSTKFRYANRSDPDVRVEYIGRSSFFEIVPGQTYVVVSKLEESVKTAREFDGLIVINKYPNNPSEIEVFAITTEAYENYGNHAQLVEKLKIKFGQEQTRGYRNGLKAQEVGLDY